MNGVAVENRMCAGPDCTRELRPGSRADKEFCSQACRLRAFRQRRRLDRLRSNSPETAKTLTEMYDEARAARANQVDDQDGDVYVDEFGYADGLLADQDQDDASVWSDAYRVQMAVEKIEAHYRELARPYLDQLRRNPGVRPLGLVRLEQECADKISAIVKSHEHAAAMGRAARTAPQRLARAQERQDGIQNMAAFSRDLGRGGRYRPGPEDTSKATSEVFAFPERAEVFGTDDRSIWQRSQVAKNLGQRVFSPDGWV